MRHRYETSNHGISTVGWESDARHLAREREREKEWMRQTLFRQGPCGPCMPDAAGGSVGGGGVAWSGCCGWLLNTGFIAGEVRATFKQVNKQASQSDGQP